LNAIETLRQLDHRRLGRTRAAPRGDLRQEADERDGDERRREEAGYARRASGGGHGGVK
jgi:hypothetical protein